MHGYAVVKESVSSEPRHSVRTANDAGLDRRQRWGSGATAEFVSPNDWLNCFVKLLDYIVSRLTRLSEFYSCSGKLDFRPELAIFRMRLVSTD